MQSIYFIIAMASDWLVGHEGTLLGAQSDGLGPRYPHHCAGWRFHLARVDKQSERVLRARDQLFALVYPLCLSTVVLYWAVIIPTQADERADAFRNGLTVVDTVLSHGAQWHCAYHSRNILTRSYSSGAQCAVLCLGVSAIMLNIELSIVHHALGSVARDALFLSLLVAAYVSTVIICQHLTGVKPYPNLQNWASTGMWHQSTLYGGALAGLSLFALVLRLLSRCIWRKRILREIRYSREVSIHQSGSNLTS